MYLVVPVFLAFAVLLSSGSVLRADTARNLQAAGDYLGQRIGDYLASKDVGGATLVVGAFRFGDDKNVSNSAMGMATTQLQGHLIETLGTYVTKKSLQSKYTILDVEGLSLQTGGAVTINLNDLPLTRSKLAAKGITAAVVGTFKPGATPNDNYECVVTVILPGEVSSPFMVSIEPAGVDPFTPAGTTKNMSGRFVVEILARAKGEIEYRPLELRQAVDQTGPFRDSLRLSIDREKYFGQPFMVKLQNVKEKSFVLPSANRVSGPNDKDRVIGVALFLDGVSSVYASFGQQQGEQKKDTRHPAYVGKHLLTADDRELFPGTSSRFDGFNIKDCSPPGGSIWLVKGFQKNSSTAAQFVFGSAAQSVGTGLGQNVNQIGLISAYFYVEELADDPVKTQEKHRYDSISVIAGPDIPSPVQAGGVKSYYPFPAEVWHIQYAYSDDPDAPPLGPPIQPGN